MTNKYYKNFRRGVQTAFALSLGGLFAVLGVLEMLFLNRIWGGIFLGVGLLIMLVPQLSVHARYCFRDGLIRYNKGYFSFASFRAEEVAVLLITVYDSYRAWKGYKPVYTQLNGEKKVVPAMLLLKEANERDLELCDTRCNAKICCKENVLAEMYVDFRFLREFVEGGFHGKVYISEPVYLSYKLQFDALLAPFEADTVIFRRTDVRGRQ